MNFIILKSKRTDAPMRINVDLVETYGDVIADDKQGSEIWIHGTNTESTSPDYLVYETPEEIDNLIETLKFTNARIARGEA